MTTEPAQRSVEPDEDPEPQDDGSVENGSVEEVAAEGSVAERWFAPGWNTPKVVLLVVVVALVAAMLGAVLQDRAGIPSADSVDVGFLQDMIAHHEQAIQLGVVGVANAEDADVAHFALESVVAQQYEIGYMEAILEGWGHGTGDPDRDAMAWMDMPTAVEDMPGMASADELEAFRRSSGAEADAAFLRLMTEHHRGGVHMAKAAAAEGSDDRVVALAERMARNQTAEIAEYDVVARRLGFEP